MTGVETLRFVLGDQLSESLSSLRDLDPARDLVLMAEVAEEIAYVPHHPKKIALVLSAMRHFAAALEAKGVRVDYVRLDDPDNSGSFGGELRRAAARHRPKRVVVCEPGEHRVWEAMQAWRDGLGLPLEIRADDRFLCARADFAVWAEGRKQPRMEHFYRWMRRRSGILMDEDGAPKGGAWNFDKENRKRLPRDLSPPPPPAVPPDALTLEVLALVREGFAGHFGRLEGFDFAVTRRDALDLFRRFVETALPRFGDYQDAMKQDAAVLFHSVISPYLNLGLLDPREVCEAVEAAYDAGAVPINAAEGFIRQILGWREYVRGIYWLKMPDYAETNALGAVCPLPDFYWSADTDMNCLRQCIGQTRDLAYAHHIQRLMVTGNFALLLGVRPKEVCDWYLAVYADAFDWVELPNTHGMVLHADGGFLGSKPYAASGKYIDRMSDYCRSCAYDVKTTTEADSCPFNALYWNFLMEQEDRLSGNPRMAMPYRNLARMEPAKRRAIRDRARRLIAAFCGD